MNYKKAVGFGVLIWLIMFALISALLTIYQQYAWMGIVMAVVGGILGYIFAKYMKLTSSGQAFTTGLLWIVTGLILDFAITMRFNAEIFNDWTLWLGYALLFLSPFLRIKKVAVM